MILAQLQFLIAQAMAQEWTLVLVQGGIAGAVLAWFMFRTESRLKGIENANERMARANLILVLALKQANEAAKEQAREIIKEIDDSKLRDGKT